MPRADGDQSINQAGRQAITQAISQSVSQSIKPSQENPLLRAAMRDDIVLQPERKHRAHRQEDPLA